MTQETLPLVWNMICFFVGMFITWCICKSTEQKPLLTEAQLFDVLDRIGDQCNGDYAATRVMQNELYGYLKNELDETEISKQLLEIIVAVQNFNIG